MLLSAFFICGLYENVREAWCWQASRLAQCNTLTSDSNKSINLALSHFSCENGACWTFVRRITSENLYILLKKDFFFVSLHLNNSPLSIGLNATCPPIFLCSDWETYWIRYWLVQLLTAESVTWSLFWSGIFKSQHTTVLRIVQRAIATYKNLPVISSNHQMYLPINILLRKSN